MTPTRLFWRIYLPVVLIAALVAGVMAIYAELGLRRFHEHQTERFLSAVSAQLADDLARHGLPAAGEEASDLCRRRAAASGCRITLVLRSGAVLGDSEEDPARMDNHADRPEIREAIARGRGMATRHSDTLARDMMYLACALPGREPSAVVRAAVALSGEEAARGDFYAGLVLTGLLALLAAAAAALLTSRGISRPLGAIRDFARDFVRGRPRDLRPAPSGVVEIDDLSTAVQDMTRQLRERIATISRQSDEQSALLSCMSEGVIAVDGEARVLRINERTAALFQLQAATVAGRALVEVIRNAELLAIVERTLGDGGPVEGLVHLAEGERCLQARGALLRGPDGLGQGAVIVLSDITGLLRLESIRRDFVANVSHELKTPVTAIKGFSETLLEGGVEEAERHRFLRIIAQQSERLQSIIEDLLTLSSIEHDGGRKLDTQKASLAEVVAAALRPHQPKADAKGVTLRTEVSEQLVAEVNVPLLEQAVSNLLDNAIKYSDRDTTITVQAAEHGAEVLLRVIDQGPGIEARHLPRLFERFYRVDKGRSRAMGGTGLGLAIVKGIALGHGGRVEVQSEPGKGSTFTLHLPKVAWAGSGL